MAANRKISPELQGLLRVVKNKYKGDFTNFYDLFYTYSHKVRGLTKSTTVIAGHIKDVLDVPKKIDKILMPPTGGVSEIDITNLNSSFQKVNQNLDDLIMLAKTEPNLSEGFEKIFEEIHISPKTLKSEQAIITNRVEVLLKKKPSITDKWKQASPKSFELAKTMGEGVLSQLLGPFGTIVGTAFGVGKEVLSMGRKAKSALDKAKLTESVLSGGERTPEGYAKMQRRLAISGKADVPRDTRGFNTLGEKATQQNSFDKSSTSPVGTPRFGGGGNALGTAGLTAEKTLFSFFNSRGGMLRTKWSKRLFELLGGKKGKEQLGGKSPLNIIPGAIPTVLTTALTGLSTVVITGVAAYLAGKQEQKDAKKLFGEEAFKEHIDPSKFFKKTAEPTHAIGTGAVELVASPQDLTGSLTKSGVNLGLKASGSKLESASMPSASNLLMMGGMNLVSRVGAFIEKKFSSISKKEDISKVNVSPSDNISSVPNRGTPGPGIVPLVVSTVGKVSQEGFGNLIKAFQELTEKLVKTSSSINIPSSGKNAFSIGDPMTDGLLNASMLDISSP